MLRDVDVSLVADLARGAALLHGLGLGGRAVLVGAADEEDVVASEAAVARVGVGAEHAADKVAQVRHVVHVRQSARHQHVPPPRHRKNGLLLRCHGPSSVRPRALPSGSFSMCKGAKVFLCLDDFGLVPRREYIYMGAS